MTNLSEHSFELIYKDIKYSLRVTMGSHTLFYIHVNGEAVCEAEVLVLQDGGLKVLLGGRAHSVYTEPSKVGLKVHVDGHPCFFPDDFDPTKMSAPGTGKLIRYLVPDGGRAVEGVAYCEVEVMKTVMPLLATSTGLVTHLLQPGAALETGDALCAVEVEDPSSVKVSQPFSGEFTKIESRKLTGALKDDGALVKFNVNTAGIHQLLAGYDFNKTADPVTPLLEVLGTLELALDDFSETKQAVSSRASKAALAELASIEEFMQSAMVTDDGTDVVSVAVKRVRDLIDEHGPDFAPLRSFVDQFEGGLHMNRVRVLTRHLETFLDAEEPFACSASFEDAIMVLRSRYRG